MRTLLLSLLLVPALLGGCATNPVTGKQDFVLMSQQDEINLGKKLNQQVLQQYPVYNDVALQDYVQYVGQKVAAKSDRPNLQYHFTVLDSDEVNAFALPGGWIYITRGIMAYLNSEAQLAAVLGHEIGHVAARHAVRQYSARQLTGLGAALGAAFIPGLGQVAGQQVMGLLGTAMLRGYGREQELEADRLGAKYMARSGYDPEAMLDVLRTLKGQEAFELKLARAEHRQPHIYHGLFANDYLRRIDGLTFGKDDRNGIIRGRDFYDGPLDFAMRFPARWQIQNQPNRVLAVSPARDAMLQLSTLPADPRQTPAQFLTAKLGVKTIGRGRSLTIHGLHAYTTTALINTGSGRSLARVTVIYHQRLAFILAGITKDSGSLGGYDNDFLDAARSFRSLTSAERAFAMRTDRLKLIRADAGTSFKELAARTPLQKFPEDQIRLLNAMYPQGKIRPGELIKTVEK
ncbi:MAG: M48 family metalloprotease [Gammaproteobacteria bacterium]